MDMMIAFLAALGGLVALAVGAVAGLGVVGAALGLLFWVVDRVFDGLAALWHFTVFRS